MGIDWLKWGAVGLLVLIGWRKMREIIQAWKNRPQGITVHNPEYLSLVKDISDLKQNAGVIASALVEISTGQKIFLEQHTLLLDRVDKLEIRLPS